MSQAHQCNKGHWDRIIMCKEGSSRGEEILRDVKGGGLFWQCAPWIASSAYPERVGVPVVPSGQEARVSDGRTEG